LINKVASSVTKYLGKVTRTLDKIGMPVFILMVVMLVYSVIVRKIGYPMKGVMELSEFGMVLVTFLFMSENYFKADQMTMDTFVEKLPKKACLIIGALVHLINVAIIGIMAWRLFVQASIVQDMGQTSTILALPIHPFIYIAGACSVVLTVVYIHHFLDSLVKTCEAWRT
jgi:TRAP-type C4-dicarboxylate transport system permease small subunit